MTFLWIMILAHWLHVLGGILFIGGHVVMTIVVWPYLLRRPAVEAREAVAVMGRPLSIMMAAAGHSVIWLGLLRGTYFGPIQSLDTLLSTAYGHTFLFALAVTILVMAHDGVTRGQIERRVWDGDHFRPDAARYLRRHGAITLGGLAIILTCMILMRFGL